MNAKRAFAVSAACVIATGAAISLGGCASCSRAAKNISSDFGGGIERTVTAYDYNGKMLGEWSGKFDISSNDQEFFFDDEEGHRVIIQNAIVISEEN